MKAKFTRKFAIMCLSAVMTLGIGVSAAGFMSASAADVLERDVQEIGQEYLVDTVVTISDTANEGTVFPKKITVKNKYNQDVEAEIYSIKYPNGIVKEVIDEIELNVLGKYTVNYKATGQSDVYFDTFAVLDNFANIVSDGYFEKKIDITSIKNKYSQNATMIVSNVDGNNIIPKSIVVDGAEYVYAKTLFPNKTSVTSESFSLAYTGRYVVYYVNSVTGDYYTDAFTCVASSDNSSTEYAGVRAVVTPGTSFDINKVINLNDSSIISEDGTVDLFSFKHTVGNGGVEYFVSMLYITIQDVNDPNVYIKLNLENQDSSSSRDQFYWRASTKELPDVGLRTASGTGENPSGNRKYLVGYVDGERYKGYHSWAGQLSSGAHKNHVIRYNPITNVISVNGKIITDLDEPSFYDAGAKLFKGFPSGNVKISVSSADQTDTYYLEFNQIGNSSGEELCEMLSRGVPDDYAPEISVDFEETQVGSVYAKLNSDFKLPSATAIDPNNASPVSIRVYKNYSSSSKELVPLNDDGTVTLSDMVLYTAEYISYDVYGNYSKFTFNIVPKNDDIIEEAEGYIVKNGNISLKAKKISLTAGKKVDTKLFDILTTFNNASKLKLNVSIRHAGETVYSVDVDSSNINEDIAFNYVPVIVGDYTVVYTYSDNVTSESFSYNVECVSDSELIGFVGNPFVNKYYIFGMEYDLSDFTAYKFGDNLEAQVTKFYVDYKDIESVEGQSDSENWIEAKNGVFVVGTDSEVKADPVDCKYKALRFKFVSSSAEYVTDFASIIDVRRETDRKIEVKGTKGNLDYGKYFDLSNFDSSIPEGAKYYLFDAKTPNGSAELKVISPLTFDNAGGFNIAFSTFTTHRDFSKLTVKLTDAYDSNNFVNFHYELIGDETVVYVDGGRKYPTKILNNQSKVTSNYPLFSETEGQTENKLDYSFNLNNQIITSANKQFSVNFKPTNNLFYVSIELGNIVGENAAIAVTTVGNSDISISTKIDNKAPITYYMSSAGNYAVGSEVTIYAPTIADFATPFNAKNASVKVTLNNTPVTSVEGVTLDGKQDPTKNYTLKISDFVTYRVDYSATDIAGKNASTTYRITGIDKVNPVITLNYGFNENTIHNVTLGKPFSIDYSVSDDRSNEANIQCRVIIFHDETMRPTYSSLPMEYSEKEGDYITNNLLITDTCTLTTKGMYTVYVYAWDEANNTTYAKYKLNVR